MDELLVGSLASVGVGVATFYVTRWRSRLDEVRSMKRDFLTRLMAYRYDITGDEFSAALNGASVAFAESPRVKQGLRSFHEAVVARTEEAETQQRLLGVLRLMFADLDLPVGDLDDEFLLKPFNTRVGGQPRSN